MSLEFLILIGVVIMLLDQIRRLRALNAQQKSDLENQLVAKQAQIDALTAAAVTPEAQAELDAFEADLTSVPVADPTKDPA